MSALNIDWSKLDSVQLKVGAHKSPAAGLCLLEAVAWVAGEPHSDQPKCVCPVIASFGRKLNDRLRDDERQRLKACASEMVGTRGSRELRQRRAFRLADFAVREMAASALESRGRKESAALLRGLAPIVDRESALAARTAADAAAADAAAYADAAAAAAWSAYAAAAWSAYAAAYAAYAAAYAADDAAAYAAAAARRPIVDRCVEVMREICAMREEP